MLKNLNIQKFKVLENENLDIRPLTVFCGENSSGKSTAIMATLLFCDFNNENEKNKAEHYLRYVFEKISHIPIDLDITVTDHHDNTRTVYNHKEGVAFSANKLFNFNPYFLHAERVGPRPLYEKLNSPYNFLDMHGKLAPFFYHQKQNDNISELAIDDTVNNVLKSELTINDTENVTLRSQVAYWLNHILGTTVKTENIQDNIIVSYQAPHDVEAYSPLNTGFGTSMVFPILIACLTAKIGDTVIIENPEVHLHPKAQSKLADFFAFIAQKGVQIILETHCEHLIYKLCYNVNQGIIDYDKVVFQYKEINKPFDAIYTDKKGRFVDEKDELRDFPTGFFDATLKEYMSIF